MSSLQPNSSPLPAGDAREKSTGRITHVIPTATLFAAALERLNRKSTLALFQEFAYEIDEHCQKLNKAGGSAENVSQLRAELLSLLTLLRQTAEQHRSEVTLVKQQLADLQELSAKTQSDFESHISALFDRQIEQHLATSVSGVSAELEQKFNTLVERDLKPLSTRISAALAAHQRPARRTLVLLALLALLLFGTLFTTGLYLGRRGAQVSCPPAAPAACCTGTVSGQVQGAALMPLPTAAAAQAALSLSRPKEGAAVVKSTRTEETETTSTSTTISTSDSAAAAQAAPAIVRPIVGVVQAAPRLAVAGVKLRPGSTEAELLEFLTRPGARAPHTFTMDRLNYPTQSHEVNKEGKEQIYLLAQILAAYPTVRLEIRGHNDGTESEVYTGPNPIPGYTLSQLRADCVLRRLQGLGVLPSRMRLRGMGAAQPVAEDRSAEGRQLNRRVELVVLPH